MPLPTSPQPWRAPASPGLEEVANAAVGDTAGALAFALSRLDVSETRPILLISHHFNTSQQGGWHAAGLARLGIGRVHGVATSREQDTLWAMEEVLRSGAAAAAIGFVAAPTLLATRRLDFAARERGCLAVVLRPRPDAALSAARRRWIAAGLPSAPHPEDARAPGAFRLHLTLTRSRSEPPASWTVEWDDETHHFHLAAGLADHRVVAPDRVRAA